MESPGIPLLALGSPLCTTTSSLVTSSTRPAGAAGRGCPDPWHSSVPGHHGLLCKPGSAGWKFASRAGAVIVSSPPLQVTITPGSSSSKGVPRGTHDIQQGSVPHPWLPVLWTTGTSKGTEGWTLLECNSSPCRRPGHLLFSGATRVMKWDVHRIFSVYRYRLFIF